MSGEMNPDSGMMDVQSISDAMHQLGHPMCRATVARNLRAVYDTLLVALELDPNTPYTAIEELLLLMRDEGLLEGIWE